jgi:Co/Zn/Cd efflux system component
LSWKTLEVVLRPIEFGFRVKLTSFLKYDDCFTGLGHDHDHHKISAKGNKKRLIAMFTLTFGFFLVEIIVGYLTNSMALIADSFHMFSDVVALVVAFVSVKVSLN